MIYSHESLIAHPRLLQAIRYLASTLRERFAENPRLARLLSAHQKWLMSQVGMALHLEQGAHGFTVAQMRELVTPADIASRNTVQNYLDQLEIYRYIETANRSSMTRPRRYRATAISEAAIFGWYLANLAALDSLDDGSRAGTLLAHPDLLVEAQPRMACACIADRQWVEPPERVALFLWTEAGGLVMDELIIRTGKAGADEDRIDIGYVDARALANEFMMSRTHLQRLFNKAAEQESMGWADPSPRSPMWLSRDFLKEYCHWQARKFHHVEEAFAHALSVSQERFQTVK